eukprot:3065089-Amphidinium_carterae.1
MFCVTQYELRKRPPSKWTSNQNTIMKGRQCISEESISTATPVQTASEGFEWHRVFASNPDAA